MTHHLRSAFSSLRNAVWGLLTCMVLAGVSVLHATAGNWTGATNGIWGTGTNWSLGYPPTSADDLTILGPLNVAGALNVNIDAAAFANSLNFTNTAATTLTNTTSGADQTLTLSSSGTALTTGTGAVTIGSITANQGVNIALGASQTWSVGAGGLTMSNVISGAGFGITKTGAGTLTLGGINTYTGATSIQQGGLTLSSGASLASSDLTIGLAGSASSLKSVANSGAVTINPAAGTTTISKSLTFSGYTTGANDITLMNVASSGASNATLNFGALTVQSGMANIKAATNASANMRWNFDSLTINNGGLLWIDRNASMTIGNNTIASATAGTHNVVFTTAPTLVGSGASGTTSVGVVAGVMAGGIATYDSTYGLRPLNNTTEQATLASGMTAGQNAKVSANTTISTDTTINSLAGTGGIINLSTNKTLTVTSGMVYASVGFTIGNSVDDGFLAFGNANGYLIADNGSSRILTVNSVITGTGGLTAALMNVNTSNSTVILAGSNTYTGTTRFIGNEQGSLTVKLANSLTLQNTTLDYNNYGAKFTFGANNTTTLTSFTFGGLKGAQNISLFNTNSAPAAVALTVGGNNESTTYSGVLSGTGGSIIKVGTGILKLSGANTYTGGTTINDGTLELGVASAISTSAGAINFGGGTLKYGTGVTTDYSARIAAGTSASAMKIDTGANTVTFATALTTSQSGGLVKSGAGTLTLGNATNAFTGGVIISNGTLISTGSNNGSPNGQGALGTNAIQLGDSSNNNVTLQLSNWNNLNSSNAVNVVGTGTRIIVGTHNNTGQVHIAGAAITLNTNDLTIRNTSLAGWRINGGVTGTGNLVFENNNTSGTGNDISVRSALNNTGTVTNAGTGNYNLTISGTNGGSIGANVTDIIQNSSTSSFDLNAVISAFNTASVEVRAGSMLLNNATALRVANSVSVGSGGTLDVRQSNTIAGLNNISGGGGSVTNNSAADTTLTVGAASGSHSFSGIISDGATNKLSLTKSGAGSQTLSGASTYSGTTNLTAGTLLINNSTGSGTGVGAVVTTASTILGGTGTLSPGAGNGITINGSLAPGDSATNSGVGTLTFTPADANATFGSTATGDFQLLTNGTHGYSVTYNPDGTLATMSGTYLSGGNDRLTFSGGSATSLLDFTSLGAASFNLTFASGYTPAANDLFDLIDWVNLMGSGTLNNESTAISGLTTSQLNLPSLSGLAWDTSFWTSHGVVGIYSIVPEPSRVFLLLGGTMVWLFRRRR